MHPEKNCELCNKNFSYPSWQKNRKYCSRACHMKANNPMRNEQSKLKNAGIFKRGHKFISGGEKGWFKLDNKINTGRVRKDMLNNSFAKGFCEERSSKWKGDNVGYFGAHSWLNKKFGKANFCQYNKSHIARRYEWANINHFFSRHLKDYVQLCPSCHRLFDAGQILKEEILGGK